VVPGTTQEDLSPVGTGIETEHDGACWRSSSVLLCAGVAALAFAVRLVPLLIGGGLHSYGRYDDGVYYAAADALTFGRVPYRDFVLLHPPGLTLILTPFAAIGRLTTDGTGMAVGRLFFMAVGAANAVLIVLLARRWNLRTAIAAGVLYSCWYPAVYSEQSTILEPLGTTAVLVALLLLLKRRHPPTVTAELVAGAVLGLSVSLKIWYVATWGFFVGWQLVERRPMSALRLAAAGAGALSVVLLPFAILARGRMFDMVVRDQLLRPTAATEGITRLTSIFEVRELGAGRGAFATVATLLVIGLLVAAAVVCVREHAGRVVLGLLSVTLLVLLLSPPYFRHYAALSAAPIALVFAIGVGMVQRVPRPSAVATGAFAVFLVVALASGVRIATIPEGRSLPRAAFAAAAPPGCVMSDEPTVLVEMNRLSSDLREDCTLPVDVTGITYDSLHRTGPGGREVPRERNKAWHQYLYSYLVSGSSFVVARAKADALPPRYLEEIWSHPLLAVGDHAHLREGDVAPATPR
jgi:hypothetical protein